jgi:alpha-beta hydrolase superfamily lysophospholipase
MQRTTSVLLTQDNLNLHSEVWQPDGQAKAAVCLVHGLCHEIHNEPAKEQVLAYLVSWLDMACAAPRA